MRLFFRSNRHMQVAKTVTVETRNDLVEDVYVFPTSFAQRRLWFLEQLVPGSAFYNVSLATSLRGTLDPAVLQLSFNEIVRRHEALRTTFSVVAGEPVQVVSPTLFLEVPVIDLRELPETERHSEVLRLTSEEDERPFDLSQGPLLRAKLLQLAAHEHILLLTMHHIISDGWSLEVLVRELKVLYEAFSLGQASPLPDLRIQYADFAIWQRERLQGEELERQLTYWKRQLSGMMPLKLPTDRPHPDVQSFRGVYHLQKLSRALTKSLKELSQQEGTTLFMTMLAAFKVLLQRYTGQADISVGTPIANRNRGEIEDLIGFFVNTLIMRTEVSGELTFRELLGRVRVVALGTYEHQDLPFEKLVEELQPERDLSRTPLCQISFSLRESLVPAIELGSLEAVPLERGVKTTRFDLEIYLVDSPEGLLSGFIYNPELFDKATIERMAGNFETLLEGIVVNPEQRISALPLLSEAERRELVVEWNGTGKEYGESSVAEMFEAQVARRPQAVAVVDEEEELSYGELNRRANQVAHYLRKQGVGAETLVGICMERSVAMVVGLLGIVKAGGAYVPLDPSYPRERLAYMLADAGVQILLTQERVIERLPESGLAVISLDSARGELSGESEENPVHERRAGDLAYVIYTSGSTGRPKGVEIEQRGLLNLLGWHQEYYEVGAGDRASQLASQAFDASVWEIWPYLTAGASLYIVDEETRASATQLLSWLSKEQITLSFMPTPLAEAVLAEELPAGLRLRALLTGGDRLHRGGWSGLPFRLVNHYGPTESTVVATCGEMSAEQEGAPPIGRPIANTEVYILDGQQQLVPIGVVGELYIGGAGLARGYRQRPELTAEKFVRHPFRAAAGARLYRTGDLGRYLANGEIEYVGRIDQQVKVRGFRIELGEIENVISEHGGVREAVVEVKGEQAERRLVAYVVKEANGAGPREGINAAQLREYLRKKLPEYMVPASFVITDQLPLTPNGKVDRRALSTLDGSVHDSEDLFVAPQTDLEQKIAEAWRQALRLEKIGRHDNFFDIGGHSLLMTKVHSSLRNTLDQELRIIDMFRYPTIASLASYVEHSSSQSNNINGIKQRANRQKELASRRIRVVRQKGRRTER